MLSGWLEYKEPSGFPKGSWKKRWVILNEEDGLVVIRKEEHDEEVCTSISLVDSRVEIIPNTKSTKKSKFMFGICKIGEYVSEPTKVHSAQYKGFSQSVRKLARSATISGSKVGTLISPRSVGKTRVHRFLADQEIEMIKWINSIAHGCALHLSDQPSNPISPRSLALEEPKENKIQEQPSQLSKPLPQVSEEQKHKWIERQNQSATLIQAVWRYVRVRRLFKRAIFVFRNARKIQSFFRMCRQRKPFLSLRKEARYRKNVQQELLSTEVTYVQGMEKLVNLFLVPLRDSGTLTQQNLANLFSNAESIVQLHTYLAGEIRTHLTEKDYHANACIGGVFVYLIPQFKLYTQYINNYDSAIKLLQKLKESNSKFNKFLQKTQANPELNSLTLESFLIMPVQRLPRIEMLLKDLLKHTWETHPDYHNLSSAFKDISEITTFVNEKKREAENYDKMATVQRRMGKNSKMNDLMQPHRKLLKEGELTLHTKKKDFPRSVILFTDMILCSTQKSVVAIKKGLHHTVRYDTLDTFLLSPQCKIVMSENNGIDILGTKPSDCFLIASSPAEQKEWFDVIKNAIDTVPARSINIY